MKLLFLLLLVVVGISGFGQKWCPMANYPDMMMQFKDSCFLNGLYWGKAEEATSRDIRLKKDYRFSCISGDSPGRKELWTFTDTIITRSYEYNKSPKIYRCEFRPFIIMDTADFLYISWQTDAGIISLLYDKILNNYATIVKGEGKEQEIIGITKQL